MCKKIGAKLESSLVQLTQPLVDTVGKDVRKCVEGIYWHNSQLFLYIVKHILGALAGVEDQIQTFSDGIS